VRIVAVGAVNQTLLNLVVKGHGELRLDFAVALKAKLRLLHLKQMFRRGGRVNGVAADAAHIAPAVGRMLKAGALVAMASLAFFIHLFGTGRGRVEDQCCVATLRVRIAQSVAALAGHGLIAVDERRLAVWIVGKALHNLFVAGRASGGANRNVRGRLPRLAIGLGYARLSRNWCCTKHRRAQQQQEINS